MMKMISLNFVDRVQSEILKIKKELFRPNNPNLRLRYRNAIIEEFLLENESFELNKTAHTKQKINVHIQHSSSTAPSRTNVIDGNQLGSTK